MFFFSKQFDACFFLNTGLLNLQYCNQRLGIIIIIRDFCIQKNERFCTMHVRCVNGHITLMVYTLLFYYKNAKLILNAIISVTFLFHTSLVKVRPPPPAKKTTGWWLGGWVGLGIEGPQGKYLRLVHINGFTKAPNSGKMKN